MAAISPFTSSIAWSAMSSITCEKCEVTTMPMVLRCAASMSIACTSRAVSGSSVPVGSSAKSIAGFFASLPGKHDPLFLAAGEVTGDMHHTVGEFHLVDQVGGPVDRLFLWVPDIIERVQHVLDHPVVTIEGKRALEHDRGPVHDPGLHPVCFLAPEVDIYGDQPPPHSGHRLPARLWTSMNEQRLQAAMW